VRRVFAALLLTLVVGTAAAQPPVDYTLLCDDVVIGAVSYVDGAYHVVLLAGATCDPDLLSIAEDETMDVTLERDAEGVVTVTIGEDGATVLVDEVPQQALDGVRGAHANRAVAGHGQETAAAMRDLHQPELPERPVVPDLPEAAKDRRP
jgi:hypothetical protein